ncbi:MAG: DUF3159 domain-containing protein [Microlunatus sp.]|nr:DUF3159 domain-containing protein [Microlunatus sp.]MDN5803158.1 DUF3159 domain-containing protein [Microlunatus sp.]
MPAPAALARRVVLHLTEAVLIPLAVFYAVDELFGLWPGLLSAAGWVVLAVTVHLVRGGRPSTLLLATTGLAAVQIGLTATAGSAVVFYLQPTLATYVFGLVLLVTSGWRMPLIERLTADFVPLPDDFLAAAVIRRFFTHISLVWAGVLTVNATVTLVLLLTSSTTVAVPLATALSVPVFLVGLFVSYRLFRRAVRSGGFVLDWSGRSTG